MTAVLLAVLPVFLLIFLGTGLHRIGFPGEALWAPLEKLVYFLLFPALIVSTLAGADLSGLGVAPMAGAIVLALLVMMGVLLALRPALGVDGPAFTSVVQGTVRMNTYIGLALCAALYGETGLAAAAVAVAAIVPVVNVLCVGSLARYGSGGRLTALGTLSQLARNPLILACIAGLGLQWSGLGLPPVLAPMLEILGRAALALGLLAVGAGLDFAALKGAGRVAAWTSALKLLALPALTGGLCLAFGVGGVAASVAVLFNGLPTATSAYILARQLGGDARLMAGLITLQTALGIASLPLIIAGAESLLP
jgi:hypothetical protein